MNFLKTTVLGGIMFLIPISVVVLILGKVYHLMARIAAPLANWIPIDEVGGIAKANLLAIIVMVLVCFLAGLASKSRLAARLVDSLESGLLQFIPGYAFFKGMTGTVAGDHDQAQLAPVLARFDDSWQVAFQADKLADGRVVLYIPGAPNPWSGSLVVVSEGRVQPLDRTMAAVVRNLRALGRGSGELLSTGEDTKGKTHGQG